MLTDINLNLYRVFYICCKCNSFVEASEKLHVSQPAISKQIKNLETILGTKLFYRDNDGLNLTKDGEQLFHYINKSYNYLIAGEKAFIQSKNFEYGTIVIGSPAHIASFYLLEYIERFRNEYPNVFIRIINGSTSELIKGLQEHKIDFIIDSSPITVNNSDIKVKPLLSFDTCLIAPIDYKGKNISFTDLNYIMPTERSSMRKNLSSLLNKSGIKLNAVLEVETTDLIIKSVKNGLGAGYVVKQAVQNELSNNELIELPTEYVFPKLELNLVYIDDFLTNLSDFFIKNYIMK